MNPTSASLLRIAKQGLSDLGYVSELVQEDYAFADFEQTEPLVRRIELAAFAHLPASFESACIGVAVGPEDPHFLRQFHALGAPQILVINTDSIGRWKMPAKGDPILQERFPPHRLIDVMRDRQSVWGREVVARAKATSFSAEPIQLDFYDAGLVPTIEAIVRKKLDRMLSRAIARAVKAHEEHLLGEPDLHGLFRLVFRLLAAKLLKDRGHPGGWDEGDASEVVNRVERYYYKSQPVPPAVTHPEVQRAIWRYMQGGFHLQNVSVRTLAYIYENTLVSRETRKQQSIHGTPPQIAEYVVRRLPFESLNRNDRRVFEPFAGHAVFLIAALGRLRELLEPGLSGPERHDYFVEMLAGMEEEPFAIEVARLSLMLADYPNPDGWQLQQRDVFRADDLGPQLAKSRIVLCNPPFEDFSPVDRVLYTGLRSVNQAADILNRALDQRPALFGFVLPRTFIDGQSFREARKRLAELFGTIEVIRLPVGVFAHSRAQAIVLLAHGPNQGEVELRFSTVQRRDLDRFLASGEPTSSLTTTLSTFEAAQMPALWRLPLERVWNSLEHHPRLASVAEAHRGIEYTIRLREHRAELISGQPGGDFALGLVNVKDDFEPFHARAREYLNVSPKLVGYGAYLSAKWDEPKVIVNARRHSTGPWRLAAVSDRRGLVLYQNFIGVWPNSAWSVEAIAAVLNGYVANAFVNLQEERDNRIQTIRAMPIPRLTTADLAIVTELVREYEQLREAFDREPSVQLAGHCQQLLEKIDTTILRAYALPQEAEAELLQYFDGASRPGPRGRSPQGSRRLEGPDLLTLASPADNARPESRLKGIDSPDVSRLLRDQPNLRTLVMEAVDKLIEFIPDAHLSLELLVDPEFGDEQLFLGVSTWMEDDKAMEALQHFDREWWVHNVRYADGLLCIDLGDE